MMIVHLVGHLVDRGLVSTPELQSLLDEVMDAADQISHDALREGYRESVADVIRHVGRPGGDG